MVIREIEAIRLFTRKKIVQLFLPPTFLYFSQNHNFWSIWPLKTALIIHNIKTALFFFKKIPKKELVMSSIMGEFKYFCVKKNKVLAHWISKLKFEIVFIVVCNPSGPK